MRECEIITNEVKNKIKNYDFKVVHRSKNKNFYRKYRLNDGEVRKILLKLNPNDYVGMVEDYDEANHESGLLIIFKKEETLINYHGVEEDVVIYIKMKDVEGKRVPIISFHESEE